MGKALVNRGARSSRRWSVAVVIALLVSAVAPATGASAATLPAGFTDTAAFTGLVNPTVVQFSPDGRVFVAEKSGLIKVFDNLSDTTASVFADLRTQVHNFWDRGLLGMALAPSFPSDPYVYVLYSRDAVIGGTAPRWGQADVSSDGCPNPPGATADGCVISGRLSRLQAAGNVMTGTEQVLIDDWCQQYPSPLGRVADVRARWQPVRVRRRRCQLQLRGLRTGRKPPQSMRTPARGRGRDPDPAQCRGWGFGQPGSPHDADRWRDRWRVRQRRGRHVAGRLLAPGRDLRHQRRRQRRYQHRHVHRRTDAQPARPPDQ